MDAVSRVFFIRHAETDMAGRYCGHSDPDLNTKGRAQLRNLTQMLSKEAISAIYSSDLRRASSTGHAIAHRRNIPQLLRPALREIDFGDWEGRSWEQIEQLDPEYAREWLDAYPRLPARGGENVAVFEARVLDEVNRIIECNSHPVAVVTHGGVLRVVLRNLFGCSEEQAWQQTRPYCCVLRYEKKGESK
ncbi:MAG: histidine phosphatase family protein [Acidobacteriaceae bacterium]